MLTNGVRARARIGRGRVGHERGAVLVEAAIVMPVLVLLLFGILEWGLAFKTTLTVSSATRSGARTGSAMPRQSNYDTAVREAVETSLDAMSGNAVPLELWIYKAGTNGKPEGYSSFSGCQPTLCHRYTWNGTQFVAQSGYSWPATAQDACAGGADEIGVYVKVRHQFVSGMFGDSRVLTDHTVMRLEPIPVVTPCGPVA